jgi:hypothetical protein
MELENDSLAAKQCKQGIQLRAKTRVHDTCLRDPRRDFSAQLNMGTLCLPALLSSFPPPTHCLLDFQRVFQVNHLSSLTSVPSDK